MRIGSEPNEGAEAQHGQMQHRRACAVPAQRGAPLATFGHVEPQQLLYGVVDDGEPAGCGCGERDCGDADSCAREDVVARLLVRHQPAQHRPHEREALLLRQRRHDALER